VLSDAEVEARGGHDGGNHVGRHRRLAEVKRAREIVFTLDVWSP
jgi:hypothetical protein